MLNRFCPLSKTPPPVLNGQFSDLGAHYCSFRHIVTELATTAAVKTNHHFGSQVGKKRYYRYLLTELANIVLIALD